MKARAMEGVRLTLMLRLLRMSFMRPVHNLHCVLLHKDRKYSQCLIPQKALR